MQQRFLSCQQTAWRLLPLAAASVTLAWAASAQAQEVKAKLLDTNAWQQCAATTKNEDRLACFDAWAHQQQPLAAPPATGWTAPPAAASQAAGPGIAGAAAPASSSLERAQTGPVVVADNGLGLAPTNGGCRDPRYSEISRFYELEPGSDCGIFNLRGYRPMSVSVNVGDSINTAPAAEDKPGAAHRDFQKQELRIQVSARTKLASGLLTNPTSSGKDSLWLGYTMQSSWQAFNSDLSRPFRTTDHEPEIFYVYPTDAQLPFGWRWRYTGAGLVHQSNGQSDPLSRSWNRWYLITGAELDNRWQLHFKAWQRISEKFADDNNPYIQDYVGRGEVKLGWNVNDKNYLGLTARGSLGKGKGSGRLEWMRTVGPGFNGGRSNLRFHVQLFSGYGDSLIDYNFKRTALSVGFSLFDF